MANLELKDVIIVAAGAGLAAVMGYTLYRYFKHGTMPGMGTALAATIMPAVMMYTMTQPAPTIDGILRAGGLMPRAFE